ncbi:MAG: hypothetical protein ACOY31_04305 [Bacillota bacterium]
MERNNLSLAIRCKECGTLFEIPDVQQQPGEIQRLFSEIQYKLRFPCPDCGLYQSARGPGPSLGP